MKSLLRWGLLALLLGMVCIQADAQVRILGLDFTAAGDLTEQLKTTGYLKSGTVTYDGNQTVTLNNVDVGDYLEWPFFHSLKPLTVKLVGANKLVNWMSYSGGVDVSVKGDLTFTGTGSLFMNSGSKGSSIQLLGEGSKLTITGGCALTINNEVCNGLHFVEDNQSLIVNHSTLKVSTMGKNPIWIQDKSLTFTLNLIKAKFSEPNAASWVTEEVDPSDVKYTIQGADQYGQTFVSDHFTILPDDNIPVESVKILERTSEYASIELGVGSSYQLHAVTTPSNATGSVIWTSRDENVVTVNQYGLVTAVGKGTTYIDLWGNSINSNVRDHIIAKVVIQPASITVEPTEMTLTEIGQSFKPTVTVLPADATDRSYEVTYDDKVVSRSRVDGTITAVGYGTTQVKYTTVNGKEAVCTVTVKDPNTVPVSSITVAPTELTLNGLNQTANLTVTVLPANATDKSYRFISTQPTIATVSGDGTVTSVGYGSCRIIAATNDGTNKTATCQVTVKEAEPEFPEGVFYADTPNNVQMCFLATDGDAKECEVYGNWDESVWIYTPAIDHTTDVEVTIPSTVKGLKVVGIGEYAFFQCYNVPKITIPDGIRYIGYDSFEACDKLTEIRIPASVTEIGMIAFAACAELHHVYMYMPTPPEAGNQAFDYLPEDAILHVQKGTKSLWQAPWTEWFSQIVDDLPSHIDGVVADGEQPTYYNLSGQQLSEGARGVIIEKRGGITRKLLK